jgi:chromosome segregation ATPase
MPLFGQRVSMLEVQNRALIKTARERADRIERLEHELQNERERQRRPQERVPQLQEKQEGGGRIDRLERELQQLDRELARLKAENDRLKAEREFFSKTVLTLEEQNRELTESATKYSLWGQKVERELTEAVAKHEKVERELTEVATQYSLRSQKLERELTEAVAKHQKVERELTEAATKYSLWGQKLERELNRIDPVGAPRRQFGAKGEE